MDSCSLQILVIPDVRFTGSGVAVLSYEYDTLCILHITDSQIDGQCFFFQAEDCIGVIVVTGVQTCSLPI